MRLFLRILLNHQLQPFVIGVLACQFRVERLHKGANPVAMLLVTELLDYSIVLARVLFEPGVLACHTYHSYLLFKLRLIEPPLLIFI